jgi:hypothetical protein
MDRGIGTRFVWPSFQVALDAGDQPCHIRMEIRIWSNLNGVVVDKPLKAVRQAPAILLPKRIRRRP